MIRISRTGVQVAQPERGANNHARRCSDIAYAAAPLHEGQSTQLGDGE